MCINEVGGHMVSLNVTKQQAGQKLHNYVLKYLNAAPASFVYKMLRKKNIVLNDKKAKGDEVLQEGDRITLYLADDTVAKFRNAADCFGREVPKNNIHLKILYRNDDILVVHKPVGVLSQKAKQDDYSINEQIVDYCLANNIVTKQTLLAFRPSVCNRLDRNTSGIILAGISMAGSQHLSCILKSRTVEKYYYTIVNGNLNQSIHDIAYISKDKSKNMSKVTKTKTDGFTKIETYFEPLQTINNYTLIKVKLITGKSHQIRAHLSYLGYPIIGDQRYGDDRINKRLCKEFKLKNQLLHAGLIIIHKDDFFEEIRINDPFPAQFIKIMDMIGFDYGDMEFERS